MKPVYSVKLKKIRVEDGIQDPIECVASIKQVGDAIGRTDFTSTFFNERRIESMRCLLDLFESYNNQLIQIEAEREEDK